MMQDKNKFKDVKYKHGQDCYIIHVVLNDAFVMTKRVYADSQSELIVEAKEAIKGFIDRGFFEWDGRSREIDRVYSTRIDCKPVPEGVRRVA